MPGSFKAVAVLFDGAAGLFYKLFNRWQKGFSVGVCNDGHKRIAIVEMSTAPVGFRVICIAFHRPRFVNQLHGLDAPSLCDAKGTVVVISSSKANRICVDFLPVV